MERRRFVRAFVLVAVLMIVASACTLRREADKAGILIGSGSTTPERLDDPQFAQILGAQFNSLSPENELKWSNSEPQQNVFDFTKLDRLVEFAQAHGMAVKGHGLISGCCNPAWLQQITDPTALRAAMTNHFETLMTRYDGTMDRWDVVTEPLEIPGGGLNANHFFEVLGPDYIADTFNTAHAADSDAKLFLNESLVEVIAGKRQELYDLVAGLVADGVPIDGVGLEMHLYSSPDPGVITDMVNAYHDLGLEVAITEMDVQLKPNTTDPLMRRARTYKAVISEALQAGITDISFWGFTDKYAWVEGGAISPDLFDENYNPKPAFVYTWQALHQFGIEQSAPK